MTALVLICSLVLAPEPNNLAQPLTASSRIVIPVAGNTEGALGTHYRSDITILNFRQSVQRVRLDWLPQAGGTQIDPVFIDINAVSGSRYEDFVRQVLNVSGLGSIVVTGVTQAGIHDPGALLWISSRIWTPQPETNGTTSQSLMTIPFDSVNTTVASIFGLRRSNQYRLNVGIVNLDPAREQRFQITDPMPLGAPPLLHTVTLPPLTMQQITLPAFASDNPQIIVDNVTPAATRSNLWVTYGVSVDNVTGDSWTELGITPTVVP